MNVYAYASAQALVYVLQRCGNNLTRENVMREATNIKDLELPMLLPGIHVSTSPGEYYPIRQTVLRRFDGKAWMRLQDSATAARASRIAPPPSER
jgi:branched-chain amino acid transport system substrate-binding protein